MHYKSYVQRSVESVECVEYKIGLRFTPVGPSTQKLLSCVFAGKSILFMKRDVTNVCSYVTGDK